MYSRQKGKKQRLDDLISLALASVAQTHCWLVNKTPPSNTSKVRRLCWFDWIICIAICSQQLVEMSAWAAIRQRKTSSLTKRGWDACVRPSRRVVAFSRFRQTCQYPTISSYPRSYKFRVASIAPIWTTFRR